jgi:dCMP deaminase
MSTSGSKNTDGNRLSWERYALNLAATASERSEDPFQKVGACALNEKHMVLALGYNGLASGKNVDDEGFWDDRDSRRVYMIHAEANCLSLCSRGEVDTLASTLLPCSSCATMIAAYGVSKVVYAEEYRRDALAKSIFDFYNIELIKIG